MSFSKFKSTEVVEENDFSTRIQEGKSKNPKRFFFNFGEKPKTVRATAMLSLRHSGEESLMLPQT